MPLRIRPPPPGPPEPVGAGGSDAGFALLAEDKQFDDFDYDAWLIVLGRQFNRNDADLANAQIAQVARRNGRLLPRQTTKLLAVRWASK